jgi:glutathione S-transferase
MADAQIIFYDWPHSPFCMKVRAILDYKRLSYERINPLGAQMLTVRRKGRIGKVPALELDGRFIADSTDIAHALEQRFPQPAILPSEPRERGLCHALEDWADEALYFTGLYYRWYEREGRKPIPAAFGKSPVGRLTYRIYLRRILHQLRGQGTSRKPPEHVRQDLDRQLDAVQAQVERGPFLLGEIPYLCDFALWGQVKYLERTPVGGRALAGRAGIKDYQQRLEAVLSPPS